MKNLTRYLLTLALLCLIHLQGKSQPIETPPIAIETVKLKGKELFFTSEYLDSRWIYISTSTNKKIYAAQYDFYISINLLVNVQTYIVHNQDTMSIKIIYPEYTPFQFVFEELHFKQGNYVIDLRSCFPEVKVYPLIVKNIFCECRKYIHKED